jgi:hypothetical protein
MAVVARCCREEVCATWDVHVPFIIVTASVYGRLSFWLPDSSVNSYVLVCSMEWPRILWVKHWRLAMHRPS